MKPRYPNLNAIAVAVAVADTGSFAGASRRLGLSTSATSKAVATLEADLGAKLFRRTTRRVRPTVEGHRFIEGAKPLMQSLGALTDEFGGKTEAGLLRINAPKAFGRVMLLPLIAAFRAAHPAVEIDLTLDDRYVDLVSDPVDVVIRSGRLNDSTSIVALRLMNDPLVVCGSEGYLSARGAPGTAADLASHNCIVFRNAQTGRHERWRFRDEPILSVAPAISVSDMESATRLAALGAGLAQVPRYLVADALADGRLHEVLAHQKPAPTPYSALFLDRPSVSPRIRLFLEVVRQRLADQ